MKKILTIIALAICSMTMMAQYVDLGLPSGTHSPHPRISNN